MKLGLPKGTRDFSPVEMARRNFIFNTIKAIYEKYGFQQIETPAMENLSTLEGKYGEEGDKLLFRILNSGPLAEQIKEKANDIKISDIAEKGLRYDLTVPFARYVVMHQNEITFPFKRYQIQPVWRADRPQKGRYREFYQCDADVIGSISMLNEVELIQIIDEVFSKFGLNVIIKLNNRKLLSAIAELIDSADKLIDVTTAIDKVDKIGIPGVKEELKSKGLSDEQIDKLNDIIFLEGGRIVFSGGGTSKKTSALTTINFLNNTEINKTIIGRQGIEELESVFNFLSMHTELKSNIELDLSLARGLNYYTGTIIEVKVNDNRSTFVSSVVGGGRYDDLTGIFGLPGVSGVGISFGVDRIYDVMEECKLFDSIPNNSSMTKVLFLNFGKEELMQSLKILQQVRNAGVNAEIYPDAVKIKKQMSYADDNKIPYVAIIGSEEIKDGMITLKSMSNGVQEKVTFEKMMEQLNNK